MLKPNKKNGTAFNFFKLAAFTLSLFFSSLSFAALISINITGTIDPAYLIGSTPVIEDRVDRDRFYLPSPELGDGIFNAKITYESLLIDVNSTGSPPYDYPIHTLQSVTFTVGSVSASFNKNDVVNATNSLFDMTSSRSTNDTYSRLLLVSDSSTHASYSSYYENLSGLNMSLRFDDVDFSTYPLEENIGIYSLNSDASYFNVYYDWDSSTDNTFGLLGFDISTATVELSPVPLPPTLLLFGSALIGLIGFKQRQ